MTRSVRSSRPRHAAAGLLTVAALALAGCGSSTAIAGIEPPPVAVTTGAPMTKEQAQRVAARVLSDAAKARAAKGDEADALRRTALSGSALAVASAASRAPSGTPGDAVDRPGEPEVVALSRGVQWPRYMVVTTAEDQVQQIHLLTAPDARTPFRVATSATVRSGQVEFGDLEQGAAVVSDGAGLDAKPAEVLRQYAGALTYPKPAKAPLVTVKDPFAAQILANTKATAKTLGKLAKVTESHEVDKKQTVAIGLGDGGALVFGLLRRTDKVTKTEDAKELTYAKRKLKTGATLVSYESIVLTIPSSGKASLVAADEQLISSKFS